MVRKCHTRFSSPSYLDRITLSLFFSFHFSPRINIYAVDDGTYEMHSDVNQ